MPTKFAANTDVPVERSRQEIERTLERYGATAFAYYTSSGVATIAFEMADRRVAFELNLPRREEPRFTHHSRGERTIPQAIAAWEQACRSSWRALNLVIKAKLEAIESDISEFEDEFGAFVVLPDGSRVRDHLKPAIDRAYTNGDMRPMLQLGAGR